VNNPDKYGDGSRLSLKRIGALAIPEWRWLAVGSVFLVLGGAMGLAYPQAIRIIIDGAMGDGGVELIDKAAIAMAVIFAVQAVAVALRYYLFTVAGERIVARLRERVYLAVVEQEIGFFDQRRTGELLNRLSSDTTVLQNTVSVNVSMALRSFAQAVGGVALLLYTSPPLTGVMLLVVPPVVVASVFYGRKIRVLSRGVQDALAEASEVAEETISGIRTVRAFAQEIGEARRYGASVWKAFDVAKSRTRVMAWFQSAAFFAGYSAVAAVLWYGGRMVADGRMSVGDLTQFILYTLIVAVSIGALGGLYGDFMRAVGSAERLFSLIDRVPEIPRSEGKRPSRIDGHVRLSGVDFHYPSRPDVQVLHDVGLEVRPGEVVALVGPSGGGKSTVASLISRFYDPDSGSVSLDGTDLRDLDADWLHHQIGTVAQEPILFSTTVAANILYGRDGATREEMVAAAKAANVHDFVSGFPDGYETLVGERGVQLSGGQKQRVAIARALLKNPQILILDEATSALDAESEHLVKEALEHLMRGRTTLVIAHRLSTVKDADRVVVIDDGRVRQTGTHDELMGDQEGVYRRLVERQLAA
jgi:ATP-binding cassette subfamily B protein